MTIFDLYGYPEDNFEDAKNILESTLSISFEGRDGDYQGGEYYFWEGDGEEEFILKKNVDPFDDDPAEMAFLHYPILFYINGTERSLKLQDEITKGATHFVLLRHDVL